MWARAYSEVEPTVDANLPRIVIRRGRLAFLGGLLLVIASVWIGVPVRGLLVGGQEIVPGLGALGAGGALLIGGMLAVIALSWMVRRQVVTVEGNLVRMTDRRLSGTRVWREPLAGYRGVRRRCESRPHRYGARHWHIVELWHPEPAKSLELVRTKDPRLADEQAPVWARRLGLPLCRDTPEAPARAERASREKVAAEAAARRPVPAA